MNLNLCEICYVDLIWYTFCICVPNEHRSTWTYFGIPSCLHAYLQWSPLNSHGKCTEKSCKLSEPILHQVTLHYGELCIRQPCELSGRCELARVKLSGLHCTVFIFCENGCASGHIFLPNIPAVTKHNKPKYCIVKCLFEINLCTFCTTIKKKYLYKSITPQKATFYLTRSIHDV